MQKIALIVAGGKGIRMQNKTPKQFLAVKDLPILMRTIKKFKSFDRVIIVIAEEHIIYWKKLCKKFKFSNPHNIVSGGKNRFESVKNGLENINEDGIVAIHDGVRPLISENLIEKLIDTLKKETNDKGVIPLVKINDSIRKLEEHKHVQTERKNIYKVQTPQCFFINSIKSAYNQDFISKFTDDANVFENNGGKIISVIGEEINIKITTKEDLNMFEKLL
tara:strand:- start:2551 stop:3210 length:660 start_codon:yes stop_codon:yes gene_type:complete